MFGKIKGKLRNIFEKNEEIIEEDDLNDSLKEEEIENNDLDKEDEIKDINNKNKEDNEKDEKKSGFFSNIFKKKENEKDIEEVEELENLEDEMLEDVPEEEKKEIENGEDLKEEEIIKNKLELEKHQQIEELNEKELENQIKNKSEIYSENNEIDNNSEKNVELSLNNDLDKNEIEEESKGFFSKTFKKLKSKKISDDDFSKIWIELEIFLLEINVAFEIVEKIENELKKELIGNSFDRFKLNKKIKEILIREIELVLKDREGDLLSQIKELRKNNELVKIIILGVNGTGKTTSIAKFVNLLKKNNLSVVVSASDTFRAAAIEQLEEHSKKLGFKLISHLGGSDPAAVAFDAIEHANAKKLDVVLIDTAGRMPNNANLMMELQKIKRISKSQITIFIGDSISGNDLIEQINLFDSGIGIDGVILTKVDTDERPGSIVTCAYSINKPIYYLGVGQNYDDLIKFDAEHIANKLFDLEDNE